MLHQGAHVEVDVCQGGQEADDDDDGQRRRGKERHSLEIEHQGKSETEQIFRNLQIEIFFI